MTKKELKDLACRLALALAREAAYAGWEALESSLSVLAEAGEKLDLTKELEEIDSFSK